ncbi:MAG: hypothetical protein HY833_00070 [Candidatus Aenigmarchaeota archaeon]|nr:hypothetical protein [Candidatus Aenigmarchaeota archaeon]
MLTVNHLLFGNHPKSGNLKKRTAEILRLIKENGGRMEAKDLEARLGISRTGSPSMFYKPLAAMRKWNLLKAHKSILFDDTGKKTFKTEYELTPESFYGHIEKSVTAAARRDIEGV